MLLLLRCVGTILVLAALFAVEEGLPKSSGGTLLGLAALLAVEVLQMPKSGGGTLLSTWPRQDCFTSVVSIEGSSTWLLLVGRTAI